MVRDVMRHVNNFFIIGEVGYQEITIENNDLGMPYSGLVYVKGSFNHDGVWTMDEGILTDAPVDLPSEKFLGKVYFLDPPCDFLRLCDEIKQYVERNPPGAYQSETYGGYGYNRGNASSQTWADVFASRLRPYRRMFSEI